MTTITIKPITEQIREGLYQLKRMNVPEPYTVKMTHEVFAALRMEVEPYMIHDAGKDWAIYGAKIEVTK